MADDVKNADQRADSHDATVPAQHSAEGRADAGRTWWAGQWRQQALADERAGHIDAARMAAGRWLEMAPDDAEALALLERLDRPPAEPPMAPSGAMAAGAGQPTPLNAAARSSRRPTLPGAPAGGAGRPPSGPAQQPLASEPPPGMPPQPQRAAAGCPVWIATAALVAGIAALLTGGCLVAAFLILNQTGGLPSFAAPTAVVAAPTQPFAGAMPTATKAGPTVAPAPAMPTAAKAGSTVAPTPAKPKALRINLSAWPDTIDPQKESFVNEIAVTQMIYEGLVRLDPQGNVVPGAAETWETSSDGLSMTFTLRAGLKRADGTPLTAKDFEYAYKRTVDPRVLGEYNNLLDDLVGAVQARSMDPRSSAADIQRALDRVGVRATDDRTLTFTLKNKTGYFLMIASTWVGWPSDPKKVEKDPEAWWNRADGHNGNGPWQIAKYEENTLISFVPNPNYYGPKPKLDRIEFYWITDSQVSFTAYQKGELDVIALSADDRATVDADANLRKEFFEGAGAGSFYFGMNNTKPPFNNKAVRMAFAQAFDRDAWSRDILRGAGIPYRSWIPAGLPGSDPTAVQLPYDPKKAVQALIDAGYGAANSTAEKPVIDCKKLGEIKLTYGGTPRNHARYQWIAAQLASVFNCPITLDPVDPTVFTAMDKSAKTAPLYFQLGWIQDYPHPQNWLFIMTCDGLFANRIGYCNKDFDALLAKANAETDQARALELYKQAQKIMIDDYPGMMVYELVNWYMVKPYVLGLKEHYGTSDSAWPGQYGPLATYDIDLSKVPANYAR